MYCINCGARILPNAKFCAACSAPVYKEPSADARPQGQNQEAPRVSGSKGLSKPPQPASPLHWYLEPWRKYAAFSGRASIKEFWYFFLFNLIIFFMLGVIEGFLATIASIYQLAILIPSISVGVRRMHDTNHSGWCLLLPVVNLIFLATDGQHGDNRFGPDPMPGVRRLRKIWAWAAGAVAAAGLALAGGGWLFERYMTGRIEARNIWVEDIATGQARPLTAGGKTMRPRFSSDGSKLLYVRMADGKSSSFVIHELESGNETVVLEEQGAVDPDWGPGDASLVYTFRPESGDVDLWVLDLTSGGKRRVTSDPTEESAAQVSPDGQRVLFKQDADGAEDELFVIPFAGGEKRRLTFTDGFLHKPRAFT